MAFNESNILKRILEAQQQPQETQLPSDFEESLQQAASGVPEQVIDDVTLEESAPAPEAAVTPEEIQVAQANNEVEAFNAPKGVDRQIAGEVEQAQKAQEEPMSEREQMLQKYRDLIATQEKTLNAPKKELGIMDALPDILAGAHNVVNYAQGSPQQMMATDALAKRRQGERQEQSDEMARQSKLQALLKDYMAMTKPEKGQQMTKLDEAKLAKLQAETEAIKGKKEEPDWREKEQVKAEIKEGIQDKKEKAKEVKTTKESISNVDEQLQKVKRAKELLQNLVKKGGVADTGPLDQYLTGFSGEGQKVRQAFNDLSLEKMSKLFQGMSKAVDSDAERKMFEQSQASLGNYPDVNMEILNNMEKSLQSLKQKNMRYMQEIEGGSQEPQKQTSQAPYGDEVERNGKTYRWNPAVGKYQIAN